MSGSDDYSPGFWRRLMGTVALSAWRRSPA
jgi:hypothetical protein